MNVPMVNVEAAWLCALAFASQHDLSVNYGFALGYTLVDLKHFSALTTMTTAKHTDPSDPVFGNILSFACI